jgi:hypothetical protein
MQASGDGAVSCVGNGTTWTHPITVWRGQTFQAEAAAPAVTRSSGTALYSCKQCGGGQRVGYPNANTNVETVTFNGVNVAASGTGNLVVYYADADTDGSTRAFNVSVNGGPNQYRTFAAVGGDWNTPDSIQVSSVNIALNGFVAGNQNTVTFSSDGVRKSPNIDWIEVMAGVTGANDANLVGYWNFDEAQGSIIRDASGKAADGTLYGSTQWSSDVPPNIDFGNTTSLGFSGYGSTTYVEIGTAKLPATNAPQTVSAWIKLNGTSGQPYIVSMWDGTSQSGVSLGINGGQLAAWKWGPSNLVSTAPPSLNVWHHVAYTFDGTTHKLYVDGVLASTSTTAPNAHAVTRAQLGAYNGGSSFNGLLDDIRIYNAALSATAVANLAAGNASDGVVPVTPAQLPLTGATASSNYGSAYDQHYLIDGSMTTRWSSNFNDNEWIYVDLGSVKTVTEVKLSWEAAYGKNYTIDVSNDHVTWTTIKTVTGGDGGTDDLTGLSGTGRYVRMHGSLRGISAGYSIYEMNVFGY